MAFTHCRRPAAAEKKAIEALPKYPVPGKVTEAKARCFNGLWC